MASVSSRPPGIQVHDLTSPSPFDDDVASRTRHRLPSENRLVERLDVRPRLDSFLDRFETVANDYKKDQRKLQDLEAARGLPSSFGPQSTPTPPNTKPLPNLPPKNTVNPFFLLLPPTSTISPASLCLIFLAADHMLHSSPTGLTGAQRFVDVYQSRNYTASTLPQPDSEAAKQNVRLTFLIHSALLHLGVRPTNPNPTVSSPSRPSSPSAAASSSSSLKRAVSPSPSLSSDPISRLLRKAPTHSLANTPAPTSAYDRLAKRTTKPPLTLLPFRSNPPNPRSEEIPQDVQGAKLNGETDVASSAARPATKSGFIGRLRDAMSPTRLFVRRPSQPESIHSTNTSRPPTPSSNPTTPGPFPPPSPSTLAPPVVSTSTEADHLPNPSYFASNPATSSRTSSPAPTLSSTPSTSMDSLAPSPKRTPKASLSASSSGSGLRSSPSRKGFAPLPTAHSPPPPPSPPSFPPPMPLPSPRSTSDLSLASSPASSRLDSLDKDDPYTSFINYSANESSGDQQARIARALPSPIASTTSTVRIPIASTHRPSQEQRIDSASTSPFPASSRAKLPLPSSLKVKPHHHPATSPSSPYSSMTSRPNHLVAAFIANHNMPSRQQIIQARSTKALAASGLVSPPGSSASFTFTPFPASGSGGSGGGVGSSSGKGSSAGPDLETMRPSFRPTPQSKGNGPRGS